jgi:predicted MFS family arabinose efflux permease
VSDSAAQIASTAESEKRTLGVVLFSRTNLNIPVRLSYFFLPAISRGLGVSLYAGSLLVSVRSLTGIVAPLFGSQSDRWGGRQVMGLGLGFLILGAGLTAGLPWFAAVLFGFGLMGLAKSAYDPAMQSYVGQRVPYARRARALGLVELTWSFALLVMPLCGWLIERVSWRAPFALVAAVGAVSWWLARRVLKPRPLEQDKRPDDVGGWSVGAVALVGNVRFLARDRQARLALMISVLLAFAQENVFVVYGAWIEDSFGLTVTALGLLTLVVGVSELFAELGVAFLSDRIGKRRAVFISLSLTGCGYLLLPQLSASLPAAVAGTAFLILAFEYTIVGLIPIISGLNASVRGTLMSLNIAAISLGRVVSAPLAVALYQPGDLTRNGLLAAMVCLVMLGLLSRLRERGY